jgi:hypothetical protein
MKPIDETIGNACATCAGFVVVGLPQSIRLEYTCIKKRLSVFDLPPPLLDGISRKEMRIESKHSLRGYVARSSGGFACNEIFNIGPEPTASGPPINNSEVLIESNAWLDVPDIPDCLSILAEESLQSQSSNRKIAPPSYPRSELNASFDGFLS